MAADDLINSIKQYQDQLKEVDAAIQTSSKDEEVQALNSLKSDLVQLIQLTNENLEAVKKEVVKPCSKENDSQEIDDEYALFMSEMAGTGAFDKDNESKDVGLNSEQDASECDIEDELSSLLGMKCSVHFKHKWGGQSLCSAMVCSLEAVEPDIEFQDLQVRVLFTHPTHTDMIPCPYFLENKCTFDDAQCRFSHGERVSLSSLKDALEPQYTMLKSGSRILVKLKPPSDMDMSTIKKSNEKYFLWHRAVIVEMDLKEECCVVQIDESNPSCGDKRKLKCDAFKVGFDEIFPLYDTTPVDLDTDDSLSDTEYEVHPKSPKQLKLEKLPKLISEKASMGKWEVHTRGIGSKLMLAMGYVAGQGLGKSGSGMIEPVQAQLLPKGAGLSAAFEQGGRFKGVRVEERLKHLQKKELERSERLAENAAQREKTNVFNFLNNTLGDRTNQKSSTDNTRDNILSSTSKCLNVERFKATEEARRIEKDIEKLSSSLKRHSEGTAIHRNVSTQLAERRRELELCKSKELAITNEQKKRKDNEKLSIF